jgi:hypothetical protein
MILRLLKGRGVVSRLIEKKWDAITPHPAPPKVLFIYIYIYTADIIYTSVGM